MKSQAKTSGVASKGYKVSGRIYRPIVPPVRTPVKKDVKYPGKT